MRLSCAPQLAQLRQQLAALRAENVALKRTIGAAGGDPEALSALVNGRALPPAEALQEAYDELALRCNTLEAQHAHDQAELVGGRRLWFVRMLLHVMQFLFAGTHRACCGPTTLSHSSVLNPNTLALHRRTSGARPGSCGSACWRQRPPATAPACACAPCARSQRRRASR